MEIAVINLHSSLVTDGLQFKMILSYGVFLITEVGGDKISEEILGKRKFKYPCHDER